MGHNNKKKYLKKKKKAKNHLFQNWSDLDQPGGRVPGVGMEGTWQLSN